MIKTPKYGYRIKIVMTNENKDKDHYHNFYGDKNKVIDFVKQYINEENQFKYMVITQLDGEML